MKHMYTISFEGDKAKGPFLTHYDTAVLLGMSYFGLCEEHSTQMEIRISRSVMLTSAGVQDVVTYVIEWDDEDPDDYDGYSDGYDDEPPNSPFTFTEIEQEDVKEFITAFLAGRTADLLGV